MSNSLKENKALETISSLDLTSFDRLWIYANPQKIKEKIVKNIKKRLEDFCQQWQSHGIAVTGDFLIIFDQIIILLAGLEEGSSQMSGCSIDSSVKIIKDINRDYGLDLLNRNYFFTLKDKDLIPHTRKQFIQEFNKGHLTTDSLVLDNLIRDPQNINNKLFISLKYSWHFKLVEETLKKTIDS